MACVVAIWLLCIVSMSSSAPYVKNIEIRQKLATYLQELCPDVDMCQNVTDATGAFRDCECDESCRYKEKCCILDPDRKDPLMKSMFWEHSECLYGKIVINSTRSYNLSPSFYMVTSAPTTINRGVLNTLGNVSCGDVTVAPWGSLYPVFSKKHGTIFKNQVCADQYNVTDGELWDVKFKCNVVSASFIYALYMGFSIPGSCLIEFTFNSDDIRQDLCYIPSDYSNTCNKYGGFKAPKNTSATREDIIDACESGLFSPYSPGTKMYANIFCYICRGGPAGTCRHRDVDDLFHKGLMFKNAITAMLGSRYIYVGGDEKRENRMDGDIACPIGKHNQTSVICRKISCQSGRITIGHNQCMFLDDEWNVPYVYINIHLTFKEMINVEFSSFDQLISPFPPYWRVVHVAYKVTNTSQHSRDIEVLQSRQTKKTFNPSILFKTLEVTLKKPWYIVSNNQTIRVNADVSRVCEWLWGKRSYPRYDDVYKIAYPPTTKLSPKTFLCASKLYFCKQVILRGSEFSLFQHNGQRLMLNKIANTILFDGEYSLLDDGGNQVALVCLEGSGFERNALSYIHMPILNESYILLYLLLLCNIIG